jgi:hypothetical protein
VRVKIDIKRMAVAIIKHKSEELAEVLDEGIEYVDDDTRKHHARHPRYGGHPRQMDDYSQEDCDSCDSCNSHDNHEPDKTEEDETET